MVSGSWDKRFADVIGNLILRKFDFRINSHLVLEVSYIYLVKLIAMVEITMDPLADCHRYTPYDEAIERSVKVQGVNFRTFPDDAI